MWYSQIYKKKMMIKIVLADSVFIQSLDDLHTFGTRRVLLYFAKMLSNASETMLNRRADLKNPQLDTFKIFVAQKIKILH